MTLFAIIESIIFATDIPVSLDKLSYLLPEYDRDSIKNMLVEIAGYHEERSGGILLVEVAGGWQFRTRPALHEYIMRHLKTRVGKFSQSSLETLAIIAYRQPVTRAEVEHLRGVDSGGVIRALLEKKLVKILGKKEIPGRPLIYGTSKEFLEVFGLKDLKSLPTIKEIQALEATPEVERQEELPLSD